MPQHDQPSPEHDDILDNIPDADGEDEFLYGDNRPPDHDPGSKSGCLALLLMIAIPAGIIALGSYVLLLYV